MNVLVSRTGYTSELGYEIYLYEASKNGVKLWDAVLEAGKPHDLEVIGPCHIRRIEGGILALGLRHVVRHEPLRGRLWATTGWSTSRRAGLHRQGGAAPDQAGGPERQLVGVEIGGLVLGSYNDGSMIDVFPVLNGGSRIGEITSACWSPKLEKNIGFAMVPTEHSELGTEFEIERPRRRSAPWWSRSRSSIPKETRSRS